ncbi:MAG: hypothetical protein LBU34_14220 [Planctomycetaceae bacterium]|jgi:tetratricopeptide (TPR) repeat protein|nr:hypothetical protein [Planctomycetaceae bacterium]
MTEYKITIKVPCKSKSLSTNQKEKFLDNWIEKIEELGLQFGGTFVPQSEMIIIDGVLDFRKKNTVEKKLYELQTWLGMHPNKPVILQLLPLSYESIPQSESEISMLGSEIKKIRDLCKKASFDDALALFDKIIPEIYFTEELLLLKANLIELANTEKYGLDDVEKLLKLAVSIYPDSYDALFEIGKYYDVVESDTAKALESFNKAKAIAEKKLREVTDAIKECERDIFIEKN